MNGENKLDPTEYKVVVTELGTDARARLIRASGLSANVVAHAMASGAAWLRNRHGIRRIRRRSAALAVGDEIFLNYDATVLAQRCPDALLVADGERWSVWHKPAGMRSQGSRWGDHTTLSRFAETKLTPQRDAFIVHRLDLAAEGLMLLAHDKAAAASLSAQFAARSVEKRYHVAVHGKFPSADTPQQYRDTIDGKAADTTAKRIRFDPTDNQSILSVSIKSGRKHQIRRHLANAGFPVVGDRLYGSMVTEKSKLKLCASYLAFGDPATGARKIFQRPAAEWL